MHRSVRRPGLYRKQQGGEFTIVSRRCKIFIRFVLRPFMPASRLLLFSPVLRLDRDREGRESRIVKARRYDRGEKVKNG